MIPVWAWTVVKARSAWAFAKTPTGIALVGALLILAMLTALYLTGRHHGMLAERGRWQKREAAFVAAAKKLDETGQRIAQQIRDAAEARKAEIKVKIVTIRERIPRYVTAKADRTTPVPVGFVRVFNASAEGTELPATPSGPVDTASDVALSTVADVTAHNHGVALELEAEVKAWREWYPEQKAAWESAGLRGPRD